MLDTKVVFILIIFTVAPVSAEVYKWTDEQGRVHFGDRPNSDQAEQITLKKHPKSSSSTPNTSEPKVTQQRLLDMYQQEREKKKAAKQKQKEEAEKLAVKCANARDDLRRYERSRLYENLPNGERRYFSEEERTQAISRLRKNIKQHCK